MLGNSLEPWVTQRASVANENVRPMSILFDGQDEAMVCRTAYGSQNDVASERCAVDCHDACARPHTRTKTRAVPLHRTHRAIRARRQWRDIDRPVEDCARATSPDKTNASDSERFRSSRNVTGLLIL